MRILEVILKPAIGGAETLVAALTFEFEAAGHQVEVVALDPPASQEDADTLDVLMRRHVSSFATRRPPRAARQIIRAASSIRWLQRHRSDFDVLHAHSLIPNAYVRMAAAATFSRSAVVITLHSATYDYGSRRVRVAERALSHWTKAIIAVSPALARDYCALVPSLSERVRIVPNGISASVEARSSHAKLPRLFVATCRLVPTKDIATMLMGFAMYRSLCGRDVKLQIAGPASDEEYARALLALTSKLGLLDVVSFLGPRSDVPELLAGADAFLQTSLAEANSLSVVEAAAAGLPMVVSDLESIRASLGEVPLYFSPGDPHSLASALHSLDASWLSRTRIASAAAPEVAACYSMAACARAYLDVFLTVSQRA